MTFRRERSYGGRAGAWIRRKKNQSAKQYQLGDSGKFRDNVQEFPSNPSNSSGQVRHEKTVLLDDLSNLSHRRAHCSKRSDDEAECASPSCIGSVGSEIIQMTVTDVQISNSIRPEQIDLTNHVVRRTRSYGSSKNSIHSTSPFSMASFRKNTNGGEENQSNKPVTPSSKEQPIAPGIDNYCGTSCLTTSQTEQCKRRKRKISRDPLTPNSMRNVKQPNANSTPIRAGEFFRHLDSMHPLKLEHNDSPAEIVCNVRTKRKSSWNKSLWNEYEKYVNASKESGVNPISIEKYKINRSDFFRTSEIYDGFLDE